MWLMILDACIGRLLFRERPAWIGNEATATDAQGRTTRRLQSSRVRAADALAACMAAGAMGG